MVTGHSRHTSLFFHFSTLFRHHQLFSCFSRFSAFAAACVRLPFLHPLHPFAPAFKQLPANLASRGISHVRNASHERHTASEWSTDPFLGQEAEAAARGGGGGSSPSSTPSSSSLPQQLLLPAAAAAAAAHVSDKMLLLRTIVAAIANQAIANQPAPTQPPHLHPGAAEPAAQEMTAAAHPKLPMTLLISVKALFDTLVWLQLCNSQGVSVFSFVCLPPRLPRPFAGAPVYDMSLTHAERLRAVGSGFKGRLVRLLSLGVGRHFEPQRNRRACHQMMLCNARRVASKPMAQERDDAAKEAEELCASGQCAAAIVPLQHAIDFGDFTSLALKAWLLIGLREGVAEDAKRGFELAEEGARLGCHHCQGVLAWCLCWGYGCQEDRERSLELARESSGRDSRYGQLTLGALHDYGRGGVAVDYAQAVAFYRLAAAQGLDEAQQGLGCMHYNGLGVDRDYAEALRWWRLAAAQGHPQALYWVGFCHEEGLGVAADVAEAIRWYRRAQAAGHEAADELLELGAL